MSAYFAFRILRLFWHGQKLICRARTFKPEPNHSRMSHFVVASENYLVLGNVAVKICSAS